MNISVTVASYNTTIAILFAGVAPIIWSPLANSYGRRPIFIFVSALGIASQCACAVAPTWSGILAARVFVGIGTSAGMGIGGAVVVDMFCMHERGRHMGIYTVFVSNGAHAAAIVGGFTALNPALGWRWCYWVSYSGHVRWSPTNSLRRSRQSYWLRRGWSCYSAFQRRFTTESVPDKPLSLRRQAGWHSSYSTAPSMLGDCELSTSSTSSSCSDTQACSYQ